MNRGDRELVARIVDQVERGIRRDGLLSGHEAGTEAKRRFDLACPWSCQRQDDRPGGDPRWVAYQREVERAMARLYAPAAGPTDIETDGAAPLAILPELARWARSQHVEVRTREARPAEPSATDGPETIDMFGGAA